MRAGLGLMLAAVASVAWAQDARGLHARSLAASCAACHGTFGHGVDNATVPPLAGRPAAQTVELFKAFRSGARPGSVMPQIAKGYSDSQIEAIAAVLAQEKP